MAFGRQRDWTGYVSGWCPHCGRRRGTDGRCNNCDPWFTSPLVQVGGPFVAIVTVFLIAGAVALSPRRASSDTPASAVLAAPEVSSVPSFALSAPTVRTFSAPSLPPPPNPATVAATFEQSAASDAAQFQQLEYLRSWTSYVDSRVDQIRVERRAQERQSYSGFSNNPNLTVVPQGASSAM